MNAQREHIGDILPVAEAWSSKDDWGLLTVSISTLRDLAVAIERGDNPLCLAAHASHTKDQCIADRCAEFIPNFVGREEAARLRIAGQLQARREASGYNAAHGSTSGICLYKPCGWHS